MNQIKTTQINDVTYKLSIEGIEGDYIFETIKTTGDYYEKPILERWEKYISDSKIILDIGANLGNHTLFFSKHTKYQKIVCFEPYVVNFERLSNNIKNNGLENIIAVNKGAGSKAGFTEIKEVTETNLGATTLEEDIKECGEIEIVNVDSYLCDQNIQDIDFVKIDTEGYEELVLQGMVNTLKTNMPIIWVEISEKSYKNVIDMLVPFGYRLVDAQGFNMLFIHGDGDEVSQYDILDQMLNSLGRATRYYQLYEKVKLQNASNIEKMHKAEDNYNQLKKWYENDAEKIEALNRNISILKEWHENDVRKIEALNQNISILKEWHENDIRKIEGLDKNIDTLKKWHENDLNKIQSMQERNEKNKEELKELRRVKENAQEKLADMVVAESDQVIVLKKAKALLQSQQLELRDLRQVQENYMLLLNKIDGKWYGRLAMKIYRRMTYK